MQIRLAGTTDAQLIKFTVDSVIFWILDEIDGRMFMMLFCMLCIGSQGLGCLLYETTWLCKMVEFPVYFMATLQNLQISAILSNSLLHGLFLKLKNSHNVFGETVLLAFTLPQQFNWHSSQRFAVHTGMEVVSHIFLKQFFFNGIELEIYTDIAKVHSLIDCCIFFFSDKQVN